MFMDENPYESPLEKSPPPANNRQETPKIGWRTLVRSPIFFPGLWVLFAIIVVGVIQLVAYIMNCIRGT
jgi:hypothetical protein